jgi:hypothetical protein
MGYVFAVQTLGVDVGSVRVKIGRGEARHDDDPVVLAYPELFTSVPPGLRTFPDWSPPVEQATAAPGERRSTRRVK